MLKSRPETTNFQMRIDVSVDRTSNVSRGVAHLVNDSHKNRSQAVC